MNTHLTSRTTVRPRTVAVSLALAGAAAGALALPGVASADSPIRVHEMVLTGRYADATFRFVGKDENSPSIGDEFIDSGPVRVRGGKVVGQLINVCQLVAGTSQANEITHCTGSITMRRGQLLTAGSENGSDDTTDAITGGTGKYAYTVGTAESISGASAVKLVLRFITLR